MPTTGDSSVNLALQYPAWLEQTRTLLSSRIDTAQIREKRQFRSLPRSHAYHWTNCCQTVSVGVSH